MHKTGNVLSATRNLLPSKFAATLLLQEEYYFRKKVIAICSLRKVPYTHITYYQALCIPTRSWLFKLWMNCSICELNCWSLSSFKFWASTLKELSLYNSSSALLYSSNNLIFNNYSFENIYNVTICILFSKCIFQVNSAKKLYDPI